jgi:hypothetical protein
MHKIVILRGCDFFDFAQRCAVDKEGGCQWKRRVPAAPTTALSLDNGPHPSTTLSFVIPSEAEGSAVLLPQTDVLVVPWLFPRGFSEAENP